MLSLRHARRDPWADAVHAFGARPQFDTEGISSRAFSTTVRSQQLIRVNEGAEAFTLAG